MGTAHIFGTLTTDIDLEGALVIPGNVLSLFVMESTTVNTLEEHLDQLRLSSAEDIQLLLYNAINPERLPWVYLNALSNDDRITASRACLLAYAVTGGTQVPRELQLRACLATYHAHDSLIDAGTGSGKTLPIVLNLLASRRSTVGDLLDDISPQTASGNTSACTLISSVTTHIYRLLTSTCAMESQPLQLVMIPHAMIPTGM